MAGRIILTVACFVFLVKISESAHNWEKWTSWSSCNATCEGTQYRSRHCIKHALTEPISQGTHDLASRCSDTASDAASTFSGSQEVQTRVCSTKCPVVHSRRALTYHWDHWTSWTNCNATCDGTQYRIRACLHTRTLANRTLTSSTDISHCSSSLSGHYDYSRRSCGTQCPVWSTWSDWSSCSATCDAGTRFRGRHCLYGDTCVGSVFDQTSCNKGRCLHPVDGNWSEWQGWGACSTSCGLGYNVRYRTCNNPKPVDGGADCVGKHDQVRVCPMVNCPIDGGWGNFTANPCTVTCGVGVLVSVRRCDNPPPQYGGSNCVGASTKFDKCVNDLCKIDGQWSEWGNFTDCSVVCGTGHVRRTRTCTNPAPQANGADCIGETTDVGECDNGQCPPDIRICDKTIKQRLAAQTVSNNTTSSPNCNEKSLTAGHDFSLVETYCKAPADRSRWRLGIRILNNCEIIPLYTPIGSSDNGVHVKEVGVMADCYEDTLQMMTQSCNTDIVLKSFNLTDTLTSVHMILFDE